MALVVTQRPEEELFVEENPTIYDTPYFTSRWNAANLPLVYKISNTKFPVNTEDTIETILGVSNVGGFAQFTLDTTTFTFVNKGTVQVTNTTNYNGIWSIREVVDSENIIINAPFIATEEGNVQNYFNNYNTLVKVYSGLPEYHPLNSTNPMTLITDNPITITPNSDNEAVIDVAALIKSKINLDNDYELNDLNIFTSLYIEYSEQYDESNGTTVNTTTEAYQEDLIAGCDSGLDNFIINGDFDTNLTNWSNLDSGINWIFDTGAAQVSLDNTNRSSKSLVQNGLGLTNGTEYNLTFDYNVGSNNVTITVRVGFIVYQEQITGSGNVDIDFVASENGDIIQFSYYLDSSPVGTQALRLDNVSVINAQANPCLAYVFTTHSAQQPQYKYGGNMGEYVQNFNGGQFANKWLTLFEKPVLFKDNYFDLSTIIPQSVIQSAVQSGGFFLQIIEFDRNNTNIETTNYPITQNLGDGIYRFRLDDKDFNTLTKQFTVQILRIPVNLFVDGDQGTFDTTTDPTGNPPSDWNLEKDSRAIINFENTNVFEGAGALSFESRSIFNDDYGLKRQANTPFNQNQSAINDPKKIQIFLSDVPNFDATDDFKFIFDFYPTEFYTFGSQNIWNFRISEDNDNYIRIVTSSSNSNKIDLVIRIGGVNYVIAHTETLLINTLNTFELTFTQGVSFSLNVNGTTITNTDGASIIINYTEIVCSDVNYGGAPNRPVRGVYGDTILESGGVKRYEFKFNQEQGKQVFESVTESMFDILVLYSDLELSFGGGAWVDTTTL